MKINELFSYSFQGPFLAPLFSLYPSKNLSLYLALRGIAKRPAYPAFIISSFTILKLRPGFLPSFLGIAYFHGQLGKE